MKYSIIILATLILFGCGSKDKKVANPVKATHENTHWINYFGFYEMDG